MYKHILQIYNAMVIPHDIKQLLLRNSVTQAMK